METNLLKFSTNSTNWRTQLRDFAERIYNEMPKSKKLMRYFVVQTEDGGIEEQENWEECVDLEKYNFFVVGKGQNSIDVIDGDLCYSFYNSGTKRSGKCVIRSCDLYSPSRSYTIFDNDGNIIKESFSEHTTPIGDVAKRIYQLTWNQDAFLSLFQ